MKNTYEFLKKAGVYYLATLEENQPRVRPFGTVNIFEDKLYIQTGKKKNVSSQISKNTNVEIFAFSDGMWIRLSGELAEDNRREAKKSMLDAYPELRSMYSDDDNNTVVYYFKHATARFCSFTEAERVEKF